MTEIEILAADATDVLRAHEIVQAAYRHYITRMGKTPGPMLDDYERRQRDAQLYIARIGAEHVGVAVLVRADDHLQLDNVAVHPRWQGRGIGRALIAFAEETARAQGAPELRLYTHVTMVENIALYGRLGFEETRRTLEDGYERVFMRKLLAAVTG
jgi:ribosomal protein S18 acetylase RimI-like enzyme